MEMPSGIKRRRHWFSRLPTYLLCEGTLPPHNFSSQIYGDTIIARYANMQSIITEQRQPSELGTLRYRKSRGLTCRTYRFREVWSLLGLYNLVLSSYADYISGSMRWTSAKMLDVGAASFGLSL
jgi:hypothetical protein